MLSLPCLIRIYFRRFPFWSQLLCAVCCWGDFLLEIVGGTSMSKRGVFGVSRWISYKSPLLWDLAALASEYWGELTPCINENKIIFLFFLLIVSSYTNKKLILIVSIFLLARCLSVFSQ